MPKVIKNIAKDEESMRQISVRLTKAYKEWKKLKPSNTQETLGKAIGASRQAVARYINTGDVPDYIFYELCKALEVDARKIIKLHNKERMYWDEELAKIDVEKTKELMRIKNIDDNFYRYLHDGFNLSMNRSIKSHTFSIREIDGEEEEQYWDDERPLIDKYYQTESNGKVVGISRDTIERIARIQEKTSTYIQFLLNEEEKETDRENLELLFSGGKKYIADCRKDNSSIEESILVEYGGYILKQMDYDGCTIPRTHIISRIENELGLTYTEGGFKYGSNKKN